LSGLAPGLFEGTAQGRHLPLCEASMDLKGKVALVTGGTQGIGLSVALRLAKAGANLIVNGINDEVSEAAAVEIRQKHGVETIGITANVADSAQVEALFEKGLAKFGKLDILVNNAGITKDNLVMRMSEADFDAVIAVNLKGSFLCAKTASRIMMKQRNGKIINIASVVGINGNAGQANYSASKAGVIGLTKTFAKEFASRNIQVNAVAPGFIRTPMTEKLNEEQRKALLEAIPLGRFGEAEDIAEAIYFLASPASDYITGQVLRIDGGLMM
jgi:3-oxoacyl-[acyl-carrier protein] reductase